MTPGLANKIAMPFAKKICVTFPETMAFIDKKKGIHVGAVIREALFHGDKEKGLAFCGFTTMKPVILVMGGSSGARRINEAIRRHLDKLLVDFQIVHLCGKGNIDFSIEKPGYKQYEYINEELPDLLKMATLVISRAGANTIFECLALKKPMILVPLPKSQSRGDQIENAKSFVSAGYAKMLDEEQIDSELVPSIEELYRRRFEYIDRMNQANALGAIDRLIQIINEEAVNL